MRRLFKKAKLSIERILDRLDTVAPLLYAVLLEATELLIFAFAALATAEAILPGIVSFRMNLAKPLILILMMIALSGFLGKRIGVSFPFTTSKRSPFVWIGITWFAFLLTLSTIKFPLWAAPIIIIAFFGIAFLFWKIVFREK